MSEPMAHELFTGMCHLAGRASRLAGATGASGGRNGFCAYAQFGSISGLSLQPGPSVGTPDVLYVSDSVRNRIRQLNTLGTCFKRGNLDR